MPKGQYARKGNRSSQPTLQPTTGETQTVLSERPAHIDSGDAARGAVESRSNQTVTQPEPSPAVTALGDKVISMRPPKGSRNDIFEQRRESLSERGALKHQSSSQARQLLAEAADLYREGGDKAKEGKKVADKAAVLLFTARSSNAMAADEISTILGDTFGWKPKGGGDEPVKGGDPTASKTPFGQGEAIRKRVVRAVQAHEFVEGGEPSKFFDGLPKDKVADVLTRVRNNDLSIWSAYDTLGEIKRDAATKVHPAFDPKRVAQFVEALSEPGAAQHFVNNPALTDAYLAMRDMLTEVGREAAALMQQAA